VAIDLARSTFVAGICEVLGGQWRMPPGNHDTALRALVVWLGSESVVAGSDEALRLLRTNVRRFATAERASPLVVKHYDPARCTRWLEENGIHHLPVPKVRPSVHAPEAPPPMSVAEKLSAADDVLLRLRGIQGPGVAKTREEQVAELEALERAAQ
jgi:hypothetical protein